MEILPESEILPETEILSESEILPESENNSGNGNIKYLFETEINSGIGKFNPKRIVRISIGRGLPDEAQHEARPSPSKPSAPHKQPRQAQRKARPSRLRAARTARTARAAHSAHSTRSAQRARALSGLLLARTHGGPSWLPCVCVQVFVFVHVS